MAEPFLGEIKMFAGNFAPSGYAMCNGQILPITQNTALFSILGTTYGGNGTTTFALPDLRGRVPIHVGQGAGTSPYVLGEQTGVESVVLSTAQMPLHTHQVNCDGQATGRGGSVFASGTGDTPVGNYPALAAAPGNPVYSASHNATMNPSMLSTAGGTTPVTNIQPVLCVNFIIALQGIFPARN
jgi:microcystin-dependent protein